MTRFVPVCVALVVTMAPGVARADTGMLDNGAMLEWPRLLIQEGDSTSPNLQEPSDAATLRSRLNLASCVCSQSASDDKTLLYYELHLSTATLKHRPGQFWVGSGCDDQIMRDANCRQLDTGIGDIDDLAIAPKSFAIRPYDIINATTELSSMACRQEEGDADIWVLVDNDGDSQPDFFSPRPIALMKFTDVTGFDTFPPPDLDNLKAVGGESEVDISWSIPTTRPNDLFAFEAFCIDPSTNDVVSGVSKPDPIYKTTDTVCGIPQTFTLTPIDVDDDGSNSPVDTMPAPFASLDPAFLCGSQNSGTATSLQIKGLQNNKEYIVALVAVDFYGNATGAYFTRTVVPKPVTDLWEDIHDRGGKIEGGLFCSSSGSPVGLPAVFLILALPWLWRRRRRLLGLAGGLVIVLVARTARADDQTPYWQDHDETTGFDDEASDTSNVRWHVGVKIGPYTPDMDSQLGKNPVSHMGPYQAMFGNYYDAGGHPHDSHVYQLMPTLDVDRVIWRGTGQLAVGGSLGYMQKTAFAYLDTQIVNGMTVPTSPDDPRRPRSGTSENTFRLIPFAATITYRATQLDDLYGIPFVPYVRGGLAYYVWWMKAPNGNLSSVCKDGSMTPGCDANSAYGGTLGFTGTLGLSVRLERIDADAARSMVQSGIYHAGFYGELTYAKVNGFGSDTKLSVGDSTWFAGADFEF